MKVVLVTGGIASGKSRVCRYLESKGFPVYDCDSRTKGLYSSVRGLRRKIEKAIGTSLDHAEVIFSDESKRLALEAVVYPEVLKDIHRWMARQDGEVVFVESAIALDKPQFDGLFDAVLLVTAPLEARLARDPRVAARLQSQQEIDPSRADWVVCNDSDLGTLYKRIDEITERIS